MSKCKCKWRCDGIVLNEDCTKVVRRWICDIDSYDPEIGCGKNCHGYKAKLEECVHADA